LDTGERICTATMTDVEGRTAAVTAAAALAAATNGTVSSVATTTRQATIATRATIARALAAAAWKAPCRGTVATVTATLEIFAVATAAATTATATAIAARHRGAAAIILVAPAGANVHAEIKAAPVIGFGRWSKISCTCRRGAQGDQRHSQHRGRFQMFHSRLPNSPWGSIVVYRP
jgi:hypothetical protein